MQYLSAGSVNLRPPQICLNYAPFIRNNDKYVHVASVLVYCEPGHNQISLHICEVEVGRTNGGGICYTWLEQFRRYHLHHTFLLTIRVCLTSMGLSLSERMEIMSEAHCSHSLLSLPCFGGQWLVRIHINWKCFTADKKKLLERQMQDENSVHFVYLRSEPNSTWMWKRKPCSGDKSIFVPHSVTSPSQLIAYCMFYSFRVSPLCTRN